MRRIAMSRIMRRPAAIAAAILLLTGPLAAQPAPLVAPAKSVSARPALWVVKDKDTTIYLLGTIHLMKPQVAWFEGKLRKAYDEADEVTLEIIDDADAGASGMLRRAANPDGQLTSLLLPEAIRPRFAAMVREQGLPLAFLDRMKPWFVAVTLSMAPYHKLGYDPAQGVDAVLKAQAKADGKTLVGLETSEEQIALLDGLTPDQQIEMLVSTIEESEEAAQILERMVNAWSTGKTDALAAVMNESFEDSPDMATTLLFDRNARWADWIKARMERPGVVLLAVGAGHLAGRDSLQDKLAAIGLKVRRLSNR